ncbi:TPA: RHS repeat domain-containing protein, partial [Pseudomonas aeruginosa]
MKTRLNILQTLIYLSIFNPVMADVYWYGNGTEDKKIKSPNELCRYYAEQRRKDSYERPGAGGHISLRGIKLKYVSENIRDCNFYYIFISGAQAGSENYGQARLLRKGECSPSESYSHATGTCEKNGGPAGKSPPLSTTCNIPNSTIGNPVVVGYGTKAHEEPLITKPFPISLLYNSIDTEWKTSLSYKALRGSQTTIVVTPDGKELKYKADFDSFIPETLAQGILSINSNKLTYTEKQKEITFNNENPEKIKYHHAHSISLEHKGDLLIATTKEQEKIEITFNEHGQPKSLETSNARIDLFYNQNGSLIKRKTSSSTFNSERNYHYENSQNPRLLTGITDENGARFATWTYDNQGRAISSEHANGAEKVSLAYNDDGSTTVTNEYGKQATYRFQVIQGIKRIVAIEGEPSPNCPSSNSTFTYDDQGLLTSKRDNNGNLTTYQYNARGLETSRTEAAGTAQARTITTDWH